jgi:hypothetical protein
MRICCTLLFGVLISFAACCKKVHDVTQSSDAVENVSWELVFQDDFNGPVVDLSSWSIYNSPGNAGFGLRRPEAFSISDGNLVVTATMKDGQIVSGGMAHKVNYKYGRFEFRVRSEPDSSEATSAVVLTWPQSEDWPVDGENDIYETLTSANRNPFHTFIHYSAENKTVHFQHDAVGEQWHVLAMEWTWEKIVILRDGVVVWKLTDINAIPSVAHHLCIQLDAFKTTMTGTVRMYVDWVKIYKLKI